MSDQPPINPPPEGPTVPPSPHGPGPAPSGPPVVYPVRDYYRDQRTWSMWCHLSALAGFIVPLGNIFGPLIVWLTKRYDFPLVNEEGKKALNFQISIAIYMVGLFVFTFVGAIFIIGFIGIPLLIGLWIFWLVMVIMASVRTNDGRRFDYPLSIRFIS